MFDIDASHALSDEQKNTLRGRFGPRVTAVAQDSRSQSRNRELAVSRLRERVSTALRPGRRRRATKPSRAGRERRLEQKRRRSQVKRERRRPEVP